MIEHRDMHREEIKRLERERDEARAFSDRNFKDAKDAIAARDAAIAALREAKRYVEYATRGPYEKECREAMEFLARIEQLTKEPRP